MCIGRVSPGNSTRGGAGIYSSGRRGVVSSSCTLGPPSVSMSPRYCDTAHTNTLYSQYMYQVLCCWQQMKPSLVFSSLRLLFSLHYSPTGDRKAISKDMSAIGSDSWNAHFSLPSAFSSSVFSLFCNEASLSAGSNLSFSLLFS